MNTGVGIDEFDIGGPLPHGLTLLEASAGTGKTFTIAALVARFVAEGVPLAALLVVTFTRMATGELRERVRERLVSAESGLARARAGFPPPADDGLLAILSLGSAEELSERQRRLAQAIAGFDAATITTTHGFCQQVLAGLGVAGDVERDVTFVEDLSGLVEEVVDDLYVRRFLRVGSPPFDRRHALMIGRAAVNNPLALLEPSDRHPGDGHETWAMRGRLAAAVRGEVELRKRRGGLMTYDDLLIRLRNTLADVENGAAACARLRDRYSVALVDEFQDTDPIQWEIMRRAFDHRDATLVLIGDPKQAVYSFRGADVYAYLAAAADAATTKTLATNWRSDQGLIDAFDALFGGAQLGHEGIVHRPVHAAEANRERRLIDAPVPAPLRIRILHRGHGLVALTPKGFASKAASEALIADDLAADIVRTLSSPATLDVRSSDAIAHRREPVRPRHIAVLVPTNKLAALVDRALEHVGVPAVINGAGSVFSSAAAGEWLGLLEALERPASAPRAHAAALTAFLGWDAAQMAAADEPAWEELHAKLHRWADLLRRRGVAGLLDSISATEALPQRVLTRLAGERLLTDIGHVEQLLHTVATEQQLGVSSLTAWLRQRIANADREGTHEDRTLRLDSDAEAVQVLTIHRSKGLEFPIVYHPFAWQPGYMDTDEPPTYHDDQNHEQWTIDVGGNGPGIARHRELHLHEQRGEDLRLLYVALTRTMHQAIIWWASSSESRNSPLGRLLFAREADGEVASAGARTPDDDEVAARVEAVAAEVPGRIVVGAVPTPHESHWAGEPRRPVELGTSRFERAIDGRWRRVSYSSITSGAYEESVATEPEQDVVLDELLPTAATDDAVESSSTAEETGLRGARVPLGDMPGGVEVGDLVHRVFEATDFASTDLQAELAVRLAEQRRRREVDVGDPALTVAGLRDALQTPLGPLLGELRLSDVDTADRIDELHFELPLVGGDTPTGTLALGDVAALLESHLPADDPLAGYATRLRDPLLGRDLRGYLTGTLDLVLRTPNEDSVARYALVDYKTNWLGREGEELSAWHYRPAALARVMQHSHYALQALLYLVALHRYLRGRVSDYHAGEHLAGVLYLFLRGMTGTGTPRVDGQPCGVFAWRPPTPLIEGLSDLLDRGALPR